MKKYRSLHSVIGCKAIACWLLLICFATTPVFAATKLYYVHNDHLGTPVAMTDENQVVVWEANRKPFGETDETVSAVDQQVRFPGQYQDEETGLHHNYHRDYDPDIGRYLQSDPIGVAQDFSGPQLRVALDMGIPLYNGVNSFGLNHLYGYVRQNPLSFIDFFGLRCYVQKSTGTRVCDTAAEFGYGDNYSANGANSAYPASMNNQCVKKCISREVKNCIIPPSSPGKAPDARVAVAQTTACLAIVVAQCSANAADCDEESDCEK